MTVTVSAVPITTRKPGSYFDINTAAAKLGLPVTADKIVLIGTQASTATATAAELVQVFSDSEARTYFGDGSPLALMVAALLEQAPYLSEVWVCPLDEEGAATAASGTITIAVSSLTAGTLVAWIGRHRVQLGVSADDADSDIATALAAAINADASLPFSAAAALAVVTLTAKVKGTAGNDWTWAAEYSGTGLTATIVQPSGGATDADIQDALDVIVNDEFQIYVVEYNDATSLDALVTHLDTQTGAIEQQDSIGVFSAQDTLSTVTTLASGRNSGLLSSPYMRGTRTHPYEVAAQYAAAIAAEDDRARPLNFVELVGVVAPDDPTDRLSRTEQESCLSNGVAPLMEGPAGSVQIVRSITTYVQDAFGSDDDTLLDVQTMRVLFYVRYALRTSFQREFSQVKVADEAKTPNTTDPTKIKQFILGKLYQLEQDVGYLEGVEDHADLLVVERDSTVVGRVNASIPADIVDGLHVFAASVDLILS